MMHTEIQVESVGCKGDWTGNNGCCGLCIVHRNDHDGPRPLVVYSFRPMGATKQHRFAVATGDGPKDIVSTHGTEATAVRAAEKLAKKLGVNVSVEV